MRTHYCGEVTAAEIDNEVEVAGWVHNRRDHGGVIFIDLRDREGLVQVVFDPDRPDIFELADRSRSEYILGVRGRVRRRPEGMINPAMTTGEIEILALQAQVLSPAETPPFHHDESPSEELRLRYRYLDLRREAMLNNLRLRHAVTRTLRTFLDGHGFVDVESPMLTRATPEGARDDLVPSRTHAGKFFSLPQSPQLFKQLLMMSGLDRYYQIVRCFRDEDLRADRQPEFTQLDIEMSFIDEQALMSLMEQMIRSLFSDVAGVTLADPFPRLTYAQAIESYGTDRPDLRNPLRLHEIGDLVSDVEFKVFSGPAADPGGRVVALPVPGGNRLTRKEIDEFTALVGRHGARGLGYIKVNDAGAGRDGLQSPIVKFLPDEVLAQLVSRTGVADGDLIFFGAGKAAVVNASMSVLRDSLGEYLELTGSGWAPVWVIDFPMFEYNEDLRRWDPLHHPFTAPAVDDIAGLKADPAGSLSRAYDIVINGSEIGGGSIRINERATQTAVFELLDIEPAEAEERFGFLMTALKYGCPPLGGIAFGLDRLVMLMAGADSIRDVIAFPKTQTAACPLTEAPAEVSDAHLRELHLRLRQPKARGSE